MQLYLHPLGLEGHPRLYRLLPSPAASAIPSPAALSLSLEDLEAWELENFEADAYPIEEIARLLSEPEVWILVLLAEANHQGPQVAGYAILHRPGPGREMGLRAGRQGIRRPAMLWSLATRPAYRGQGYGRDLGRAVIALSPPCRYLELQVRKSNLPAQKLYESLGFILRGKIPNYYPPLGQKSQGEEALVYRLELEGEA